LSARECAAAAVWRGSGSGSGPQVLITNGNDASERFRDLVEFDPRTLSCAKFPSAQQRAGGAGAGATPVSAHSLSTVDGRFFYQFGGWDGEKNATRLGNNARSSGRRAAPTCPIMLCLSRRAFFFQACTTRPRLRGMT
jgi:hypothetical protein